MVEGARLESVYTGNRIEGSNPSPSAIDFFNEKMKNKETIVKRERQQLTQQ